MCKIGEVVVVGGVRRSALISLSNLSDTRMRDAKSGQWWVENPQRALSNNSAAYTETPSVEVFMEEWLSLMKSKSGERGIFNRVAAQKQAAKWGRRPPTLNYGGNPCMEIILKNKEFCNLTEVIIRAGDTLEELKEKVKLATIMGTFQSTLTDFSFVSEEYKQNCEEERLLGVSFTGIMDHTVMSGQEGFEKTKLWLNELRDYARSVNKEWAAILEINESAAITTVKPSGTVSQLTDTASGIHTRFSEFYLRTVRNDKKDPVYQFMKDKGVYVEDDVTKPDSTGVFYFPVKSPEGCLTNKDLTAIEQLQIWLVYQREWCEHKPSVTVFVEDKEWLEVGAWVYRHFDEVSGVSFLPKSNHTYRQAPYQEITEAQFNEWNEKHPLPEIDWSGLAEYEKEDTTVASQTLACVSGYCEI